MIREVIGTDPLDEDTVKLGRKGHTLEDEVEQLKAKKERLQLGKSADDSHTDGEEIYEKAIREAEEIVQQKELAIDDLRSEQGLDSMFLWPPVNRKILEPSLYGPQALPSRVLLLNQIMDSLIDPNLNMIGVYGIGGVGKTTLLQEVQRKAMRDKFFQVVVMVSISRTPSAGQIQAEIADLMGLKLDAKDVPSRAAQLCKSLKKSKVLIIIDDLWKKLDLKDVGILPSGEECFGCKVLLSSRTNDVLSLEMKTQMDFSVNVLEQEEAWYLFQTTVPKVQDPKLLTSACEIVKHCAGLPLLVQIAAKLLQNRELNTWDDMLKQLSVFGNEDHIQERMHIVVESLFENLLGEEEKSVFLLCALFDRSNIPIEYLLICCLGLDLLRGMHTIEEARNRLKTLMDNLKELNLLQESSLDGYVIMPGMVHDVAISIASNIQHAFIGSGQERLINWPPSNNCTRISLPYCNGREIYAGLDCPTAELFLLRAENLSLEIPDLYFEGMTGLKVVRITGICFGFWLPSSVGFLANLQSLCLNGCQMHDLAVITELKQLQILSFANSDIVKLPRQMGGLTQLRLLDLRNCTGLKVIPARVISKLYLLEELYMLNSFSGWDTRGNARLVELQNLHHLSTLEMQIVEPRLIERDFRFINRLQNYKISMGGKWIWDGNYETSRILKIKPEAGIQFAGGIGGFLESSQDLFINTMMGIKSVFYRGLPRLTHHIAYDYGLQHLLNSAAKSTAGCVFPNLESLHVYNMDRTDTIYEGENEEIVLFEEGENGALILDGKGKGFPRLKHIHIGNDCTILNRNKSSDEALHPAFPVTETLNLINFNSLESLYFWKLRSLTVRGCNRMKILFTFSSAGCLPQLQELEVADCKSIGAIVDGYNVNEFTCLSSLKLRNLPHLQGFREREEGTSNMKLLLDEMVSFPNLTKLELKECKRLKYLCTTKALKCLPKLEKLEINNCEFVEEIILNQETEEIEEQSINEKIVFLKLNYLSLFELQNLRRFGGIYPVKFLSLKELSIEDCPAMDSFVSDSLANRSSDHLFNEMVNFISLETINVRNVGTFKYLWDNQLSVDDSFFKLRSLNVAHCSKLSVIFPPNIFRRFQKLELLHVSSCDRVEEILQYGGSTESGVIDKIVFPKLNNLSLVQLPNLEKFSCEYPIQFPSLTKLCISSCSTMKNFVPKYSSNQSAQYFFNEMASFPKLNKLEVRHMNNPEYLWGERFGAAESFLKLKSLKIGYCSNLSVVFPSNLYRRFLRLETLDIFCCPKVEEIYQCEGNNFVKPSALRGLEIWNLPSLKHIWRNYPSRASCFKNLQSVKVHSCTDLKYVFPKSVACNLLQLQHIRIGNSRLQAIIAKENGDKFETRGILCFKFPRLSVVQLENLTEMSSLYEGNYTLKCPQLKHFDFYGCDKMMILRSEISAYHQQSVSLFPEFIRNVEELTLDHQGLKAILNAEFLVEFSKLKEVTLRCLEEESIPLMYSFIRRHSLEKLVIVESFLEEIFSLHDGRESGDEERSVSFKQLEVIGNDNVKHILKENRFSRILQNLVKLNVEHCDFLLNIAPSIASFHNLTSLSVSVCYKMEFLVTEETANTMVNLRYLRVSDCIRMENIIAWFGSGLDMIFTKLKYLELNGLPSLNCFCSGDITYDFPELKQIKVNKCSQMKTFCGGPVSLPKLTRVALEDQQELEEDLNAIIVRTALLPYSSPSPMEQRDPLYYHPSYFL